MRGNLREFSVADLMQLYQIAVKSGTITVHGESGSHLIYFDRGHVSGVGAEDWSLVGELRSIEWLSPDVRRQVDLMDANDSYVGLSLIARALLTPLAWDRFVERQIEELIYPMLLWREGAFIAEVDVIPKVAPLRFNQSPQQLILNGARWEEEVYRAGRDGFGRNTVWRRSSEVMVDTEEDALFLDLLDRPRSIADLAAAAGVGVLMATACVQRLEGNGLVAPGQASSVNWTLAARAGV
ncbi:MAG TPA: DUF4388 domain-containing protein [Thermomicrobiaceae bacterium]|nr:DUF4388 domain-containing protein [Thermomicrobiaceae bacterium]